MVTRIIIASFFLSLGVHAQTLLAPTNTRTSVSGVNPAYTLTGSSGSYIIQYTVESTAGTPINVNDGTLLRQYVYNSIGHLVQSNAPSTTPLSSLASGQIKFVMSSLGAGTYRVQGVATPLSGTNGNWNFTHHYLTVTNTAASGSAGITVNQTNINNITIDNSTTITGVAGVVTVNTNAFLPPTTNAGVVTIYVNTNVGSGSTLSVYDSTNGLISANVESLTFNGQFSVSGTTNITVSLLTTPDSYIGTNRSTYTYTGGDQTFTTPAGITNLTFWLWGGGAQGNAVGGHTIVVVASYPGEQFELKVPQGGQYTQATNGWSAAPYPNGGRGYATNTSVGVFTTSGGGRAQVMRLANSNIVGIAGGGGAGAANYNVSAAAGGSGGGSTGRDGYTGNAGNTYGGYGGSQTAGGAPITASPTNASAISTSGGQFYGGDGGQHTNTVIGGSGGGDGFYGGAGAIGGGPGSGSAGGHAGGGSGYVGSNVIFGVTIRQSAAVNQSVINNDLPFYVPGVAARANNASGGNGQITVGY